MRNLPDLMAAVQELLDEKQNLTEQHTYPSAIRMRFEEQERSVPHGLST
jgi:hypothetical protein